MDHETARKISTIIHDISSRLDESVAIAQNECSEQEFVTYRRAVGNVLGELWDTILKPLYEEHPDLRPKELDEEDDQ